MEKYGSFSREQIVKARRALAPPNQPQPTDMEQPVEDEISEEPPAKNPLEADYEVGPKGGDTSEYRSPFRIIDLGESYEGTGDPISGRQIDIGRYIVFGRDTRRDNTLQPIECSDDAEALREAYNITDPISEVIRGAD